MRFQFLFKFLSIGAVSIGLILALGSIEYKVFERNQYRSQAKDSIANGWSGSQIVVSPILRLTLTRQYEEEVFDKNLKKYISKVRTSNWVEWIIPDQLDIKSVVTMQQRSLGIYTIPVYETELIVNGKFTTGVSFKDDTKIRKAELLTSFSDMRGISSIPAILWNQRNVDFQPADQPHLLGNYISADISMYSPTSPAEFSMTTKLRGLDAIHFVPTAKQVKASIESSWPHPYFEGSYLPVEREITDAGFKAVWEVSEFATSVQNSIASCKKEASGCANVLRGNTFGVGLHNPIDIYQKTDRSLKYGFLFIALTFAVFLLFEAIKRIQIHPIQYALVGCALAIFYLLLISLSEHIAFSISYVVAAFCCVSLIGFYLSYVLENKKQALAMSAGMGVLYAMLYMILKSEDSAFLMGAVLSFVSLSALMLVTRNIDWYTLNKSKVQESDDAGPRIDTGRD